MRSLLWSLLLLGSCTGFHQEARGLFRSPQPSDEQLQRRVEKHGIKTVLSLRGGRSGRLSQRVAEGLGIDFELVGLSARRMPHPDKLLELWRIADEAERPLLVHCRAGVDRTGLAMAVFVLHDTGDLDEARGQLALVPYGHVAAFGTEAMDQVLDAYEPFAGMLPFPVWVERVYGPDWHAHRAARP